MIDQERVNTIVHALRCTCSIQSACMGSSCAFFVEEKLDESLAEKFGREVLESCDCDKVGNDAADMLEALLAENEHLSNELMVLRIKMSGDCGVCRHQHVNVLEEPCASCLTTEEHASWQYEGDEEHGDP